MWLLKEGVNYVINKTGGDTAFSDREREVDDGCDNWAKSSNPLLQKVVGIGYAYQKKKKLN